MRSCASRDAYPFDVVSMATILPAMTLAEAMETTRIHRVAGRTGARTAWVTTRPCRAPHHTISDAGLIGGGHVPMPGEVSLAHHGVLFLDEWPEFRRHVLEVLRQPLEGGITPILWRWRHRFGRAGHDCHGRPCSRGPGKKSWMIPRRRTWPPCAKDTTFPLTSRPSPPTLAPNPRVSVHPIDTRGWQT